MTATELELRLKEMEERLRKLEHCNHVWKGPFFNGTNAYEQCRLCGKKVRV